MIINKFITENIHPNEATKIGFYRNNILKVGEVKLNKDIANPDELLYKIGLISDIHLQNGNNSVNNFKNALDYLNNQGVNLISICGDVTENGTTEELNLYKTCINEKSPNIKVYAVNGEHDCDGTFNETNWNTYTGNNRCFEITQGSDHLLFLGMNQNSLGDSGTPYLQSDLNWLQTKLEEYKDQRTFVFTHLFMSGLAGDFGSHYQLFDNSKKLKGEQLSFLQTLYSTYVNVIWVSGHSHWKYELQQIESTANICKTTGGWTVHASACTNPYDTDRGVSKIIPKYEESQCSIIEVYSNYIIIKSIDLSKLRFISSANYKLNTSTSSDIPSDGYVLVKTSDFILADYSDRAAEIAEVEDGYISVTYNNYRQGMVLDYYVKTSNMSDSTTKVTMMVDDVIYEDGGSDELQYCAGFYLQDKTNINIANNIEIYYEPGKGVIFSNTDYNATFPATVKMKNLRFKCE